MSCQRVSCQLQPKSLLSPCRTGPNPVERKPSTPQVIPGSSASLWCQMSRLFAAGCQVGEVSSRRFAVVVLTG